MHDSIRPHGGLLAALAVILLLPSAEAASPGDAATWNQWRGPSRTGVVTGPAWPTRIGTNELREVWRVEMEPSYSGPVVSAEAVFTTETKDKKSEAVVAFDRQTGRQLWRAEWAGAMSVPFFAKANGDWIRSTPTLTERRLYVAGMRDVLVCLDAKDGTQVWRKDFVKEIGTPLPEFGFVCSPLVDGEAVYVQAAASFVRLNRTTGEVVWRTLEDGGGMWGSAFSSPVVAELGGERQIVVQTRNLLAGVNPEKGTVLWSQKVEAFRGMNILTPVVLSNVVYTSAYGGKTIGFQVSRTGGEYRVSELWSHKAQGYMSTPVVINGVAYQHLRSQRFTAMEVLTGRERWTASEGFGKYLSLVAQNDRILALDQRGILFLLRANPEQFELLDQRRLTKAETWAHLAVDRDQLFVRELNALVAYQWRSAESSAALGAEPGDSVLAAR
jgi:outer membrane protein assembly factor BamB